MLISKSFLSEKEIQEHNWDHLERTWLPTLLQEVNFTVQQVSEQVTRQCLKQVTALKPDGSQMLPSIEADTTIFKKYLNKLKVNVSTK